MANITTRAIRDGVLQATTVTYTVTQADVTLGLILLLVTWPRSFEDSGYFASYTVRDTTRFVFALTSLGAKSAAAIAIVISTAPAFGIVTGDILQIDATAISLSGSDALI